jgi:hypothetical protein
MSLMCLHTSLLVRQFVRLSIPLYAEHIRAGGAGEGSEEREGDHVFNGSRNLVIQPF